MSAGTTTLTGVGSRPRGREPRAVPVALPCAWIACDRCDATLSVCADDVWTAIATAIDEGWQTDPAGDLCPDCAAADGGAR